MYVIPYKPYPAEEKLYSEILTEGVTKQYDKSSNACNFKSAKYFINIHTSFQVSAKDIRIWHDNQYRPIVVRWWHSNQLKLVINPLLIQHQPINLTYMCTVFHNSCPASKIIKHSTLQWSIFHVKVPYRW